MSFFFFLKYFNQEAEMIEYHHSVPREGNGTPLQYSCLENPMDGGAWWAAVHGVAKSQTWLSDFTFTFHFHALEKEMATHSSVLAWRIPGMGEPGGLPSMGSHRVGHGWSDLAAAAAVCNSSDWRRALSITGWHYRRRQPDNSCLSLWGLILPLVVFPKGIELGDWSVSQSPASLQELQRTEECVELY